MGAFDDLAALNSWLLGADFANPPAFDDWREPLARVWRERLDDGAAVCRRWSEEMTQLRARAELGGDAAERFDAWWRLAARFDLSGRENTVVDLDLSAFVLPGDVHISGLTAMGETYLNAAWIAGDLFACGARFCGAFSAQRLYVGGGADFAGARFDENVDLTAAHFGGKAEFRELDARGGVFGREVRFGGGLSLTRARFRRDFAIHLGRVDGPSDFDGAVFEDTVSLQSVRFDPPADLSVARFGRRVFWDAAEGVATPPSVSSGT